MLASRKAALTAAARDRRRAQCEKADRVLSPTPAVHAPTRFLVSPFDVGFQNYSVAPPSNQMFDGLRLTPANTGYVESSLRPPSAFAFGNNPRGFDSPPRYLFGGNEWK